MNSAELQKEGKYTTVNNNNNVNIHKAPCIPVIEPTPRCYKGLYCSGITEGPFKCYVTFFSWEFDPQPPPRHANNVEPYTFVTLFLGKADTPHPPLHYLTLEWPLILLQLY